MNQTADVVVVGGGVNGESIAYAVAAQSADHLRRNVRMLQGIGVNTTALTAAELKELQPFANVEDSGYANPAETVEGFRHRASELGARILQRTAVTRVTGVETPSGLHRCRTRLTLPQPCAQNPPHESTKGGPQ